MPQTAKRVVTFQTITLPPLAQRRFVDNTLSSDITNGTYSIANRNGGGTDGNAYTSIKAALAAAVAADTLILRNGSYTELAPQPAAGFSPCVYINKSVNIQPFPGEHAVITYDPANPPLERDGQLSKIISIQGASTSVVIDGTAGWLEIIGTKVLGDNATDDTDINVALAQGVLTVKGVDIHDFGHAGVKVYDPSGLITIQNCNIHNGGFTQRDHGIYGAAHEAIAKVVAGNRFDGISGYGVQVYDGVQFWSIYGNVATNCVTGGYVLSGHDMQCFNNTAFGCGVGLTIFNVGPTNLTIKRNVLWGNVQDILPTHPFGSGCVIDGNTWLTVLNLPNWTAIATNDIHTLGG